MLTGSVKFLISKVSSDTDKFISYLKFPFTLKHDASITKLITVTNLFKNENLCNGVIFHTHYTFFCKNVSIGTVRDRFVTNLKNDGMMFF